MINFFKNKKENEVDNNNFLSRIASLLIHVAKIDEIYTSDEKEIIKKTIIKLGANTKNIDQIIADAELNEERSNQILDFTREIKNLPELDKLEIIEALWRIVYSNKNADMYEANLMRRLAGLIYIDDNTMGDIKMKIKY